MSISDCNEPHNKSFLTEKAFLDTLAAPVERTPLKARLSNGASQDSASDNLNGEGPHALPLLARKPGELPCSGGVSSFSLSRRGGISARKDPVAGSVEETLEGSGAHDSAGEQREPEAETEAEPEAEPEPKFSTKLEKEVYEQLKSTRALMDAFGKGPDQFLSFALLEVVGHLEKLNATGGRGSAKAKSQIQEAVPGLLGTLTQIAMENDVPLETPVPAHVVELTQRVRGLNGALRQPKGGLKGMNLKRVAAGGGDAGGGARKRVRKAPQTFKAPADKGSIGTPHKLSATAPGGGDADPLNIQEAQIIKDGLYSVKDTGLAQDPRAEGGLIATVRPHHDCPSLLPLVLTVTLVTDPRY